MIHDILLTHLDAIADAPGGIARLRQLILQLAVQGRLVEQDAGDEPASALLERIQAEKAQRAGTGKSRHAERSEASRSGSGSEILRFAQGDNAAALPTPFAVPQGWQWVRLKELGVFLGGGTPSKANPEYWEGNIPWVSPKDMKKLYIGDAQDHISESALAQTVVQLIPNGSLLFVVRGMILAHSFPVALTTKPVTINQDMKALQFYLEGVEPYLLLAGRAARNRVLAVVERSTHGTCKLDTERLENLLIPLPPLAEQRRIVARVEQLMALCDGLEARLREERAAAERLSVALCAGVAAGRAAAQPSARVAISDRPAPQASLEVQQHSSVADPLFAAYVSYMAWVVQQHRNTPTAGTLGKVKMEKAAHLGEAFGHIDLGRHPVRKPHGPADSERLDQAIAYGRKIEAFAVVERSDAEWGYVFVPLPRLDEMASQFEARFGLQIERIRHLNALLVPLKTREAEAIATLYAVWNDQLHTGAQPDDEEIFAAFRAFHPKKERFRSAILVKWLTWMREHDIVPDGSAKLTPPADPSAAAPVASARQRVARPAASDSAEGSYAAAVALLAERGALTNGELQAALGLDGAAARALLRRLVAAGLARQEGERRAARYVGLAERR